MGMTDGPVVRVGDPWRASGPSASDGDGLVNGDDDEDHLGDGDGDSDDKDDCPLRRSRDCHDCRRTQCGEQFDDLVGSGCVASRDCVNQYCFDDTCGCPTVGDCGCSDPINICKCVESCTYLDNQDGCRTVWQSYLECVARQCADCIELNRRID